MSIKLMSMVWDDHTTELTGIEKSVLLKLCDCAADDGTRAFPSVPTISLATGFCVSSVQRAVKSLQSKKRLTRQFRKKDKIVNLVNNYRINVAELQMAATSVDKGQKYKGGGVSQLPGVVSHSYQGGVSQLPNPSLDPSYRSVIGCEHPSTAVDKSKSKRANDSYKNKTKDNTLTKSQEKELNKLNYDDAKIYDTLIKMGVFKAYALKITKTHSAGELSQYIEAANQDAVQNKGAALTGLLKKEGMT